MGILSEAHRSHQARRAARRVAVLDFQLQDCLTRLERAQRDLEIIRAGLSHVLRSRLPAAERLVERMERHRSLPHAGRRAPAQAQASEELRRIGCLLGQLLLLADIERRRMVVRPVDLTALAATAVERLRAREPRRGLDVHIEAGILVQADPYLLEVLLTALMEDAWRRARLGSEAGVHIGCAQMGSDTVCFVRDNGEGFDPAELDRQIGSGARTGRGSRRWSAFGLVLARRIVERHGGRLWVDACPEIGATVYFTVVPAAVAAAQDLMRAAFG